MACEAPIVVLDFETTGLSPTADRIIEIGAVRLVGGEIKDELTLLCDPGVPLKPKITEITGINDLMLRGKESPAEGRAQAAGLHRRRGHRGAQRAV